MLLFQLLELVEERVVLGVGHLRAVEDVVAVVVVLDEPAQLGRPGRRACQTTSCELRGGMHDVIGALRLET